MVKIRDLLVLLLFLGWLPVMGQPYDPPMRIPLFLSGNFGELRGDHFHSGIDIKTMGTTGHEVFAIDEGYVSRIKVQAGGYGHALYIAHPVGRTSVYGHLSAYIDTITTVVRNAQYDRKSFEVDLYPEPGDLPVTKGQLIAWSGNTGSSSGPHLHFEIRRSNGQHPLNVLKYDFPVADHVPPRFARLAVYPMSENSMVGNGREALFVGLNGLPGEQIDTIGVQGDVGIGVEVFDYLDGARNRCGIYTLEMFVDGQLAFRSVMDEFSFAESRFINAHIDYMAKQEYGYSVQRLYLLPYNELSIYQTAVNDGVIAVQEGTNHQVRIVATDVYGNHSSLSFILSGKNTGTLQPAEAAAPFREFPYNGSGGFTDRGVNLSFEAYSFYENAAFNFARTAGNEAFYSDIFVLGHQGIPVHRFMDLAIQPSRIPETKEDKLCMVYIAEDGEKEFAGGTFEDGWVRTRIRNFGTYAVSIDTVPPTLLPLNLANEKDMTDLPGIRFAVTDDLSGIASYAAFIDGEWALLQYDPKNDLLVYEFDDGRMAPRSNHDLLIEVRDAMGNSTRYQTTFFR
jgi:hypothetical protein